MNSLIWIVGKKVGMTSVFDEDPGNCLDAELPKKPFNNMLEKIKAIDMKTFAFINRKFETSSAQIDLQDDLTRPLMPCQLLDNRMVGGISKPFHAISHNKHRRLWSYYSFKKTISILPIYPLRLFTKWIIYLVMAIKNLLSLISRLIPGVMKLFLPTLNSVLKRRNDTMDVIMVFDHSLSVNVSAIKNSSPNLDHEIGLPTPMTRMELFFKQQYELHIYYREWEANLIKYEIQNVFLEIERDLLSNFEQALKEAKDFSKKGKLCANYLQAKKNKRNYCYLEDIFLGWQNVLRQLANQITSGIRNMGTEFKFYISFFTFTDIFNENAINRGSPGHYRRQWVGYG